MTREEHSEKIRNLASKNTRLLLKLPTGFGKSKIAIECAKLWHDKVNNGKKISILIVIPKLVMIENWRKEIKKWYEDYEEWSDVQFVTYVSLPDIDTQPDLLILDECHHFTERCANGIIEHDIVHGAVIAMSGTIPYIIKTRLCETFNNIWSYSVSVTEATDGGIIPDPSVFLIPLKLNNEARTCTFIKNKGKGRVFTIPYEEKMRHLKDRCELHITCTQAQYYSMMQNEIDYWDNYTQRTQQPWARNKYLFLCGERLKWLSQNKTNLIKIIQDTLLKDMRYITFCSSIAQAKELGEYCINSKDEKSYALLDDFNDFKINTLTAVNILNEGLNITVCQIGVFASLSSSEIITKQRQGRILRHEKPLFIIPYFINTRDNEIVDKMCKDYNPELVKTVSVHELSKELNSYIKSC